MRMRESAVETRARSDVDVRALEAGLRSRLRGEVRFDAGSRALYAADASNYRQVPIGVVVPRDVDDLVEAVAIAREHGAPVLPRGGGTSLAGQCCNVAVVMDVSKYVHDVVEIDAPRRIGCAFAGPPGWPSAPCRCCASAVPAMTTRPRASTSTGTIDGPARMLFSFLLRSP